MGAMPADIRTKRVETQMCSRYALLLKSLREREEGRGSAPAFQWMNCCSSWILLITEGLDQVDDPHPISKQAAHRFLNPLLIIVYLVGKGAKEGLQEP